MKSIYQFPLPLIAAFALILSPQAGLAETKSPVDIDFTLVMINLNGVPDLLRLPKLPDADDKNPIPVSIGKKRWEESFYLIVETSREGDLPWKMEQRQINCLTDPADSTVLPDWPKRISEWREMPFIGTSRYKGMLFREEDLSKLSKKELENYARNSSSPDKNLEIAGRLAGKETANSYHCKTEIRISMKPRKSIAGIKPINSVYNIDVNNF